MTFSKGFVICLTSILAVENVGDRKPTVKPFAIAFSRVKKLLYCNGLSVLDFWLQLNQILSEVLQ